jgi:predicted dehydrogenase
LKAGLGVALIGSGAAARQHAAAITALAGVRVTATVDSDAAAGRKLAAELGVRAYGLADALDDDGVQIAAVCTPPGERAKIAVQLLDATKAVLLEKPPVLTVEELDNVVLAGRRTGLPVGVMLQHRGRLPADLLRRRWSADATAAVQVVRHRGPDHYRGTTWRHDPRRAGGGVVAHLASHYVDLLCQLFGDPVLVRGTASADEIPGIDNRAALLLDMEHGRRCTVYASSRASEHAQRLTAEDQDLVLDVSENVTRIRTNDGVEELPARTPSDMRIAVYAEMAATVRDGDVSCSTYDLASTGGLTTVLAEVRAMIGDKFDPSSTTGDNCQGSRVEGRAG